MSPLASAARPIRPSGGTYGRFAPSPTGPLHAGSLVAALASATSAAQASGRFQVRIDDLDAPRIVAGSEAAILATLSDYGLLDSATELVRQSERLDHYQEALARLADKGLLYACTCSRRELGGLTVYPGTCRQHIVEAVALEVRLRAAAAGKSFDSAIRVRLVGNCTLDDRVQGRRRVDLASQVGDIVVHRRDGQVAWPLATAIDDARVAEVVRGADLFEPTFAQRALMALLELTAPRYAHVPVLIDADGAKLGKRTNAPALSADRALERLHATWRFLGQRPIRANDVAGFHAEAARCWDLARVPRLAAQRDDGASRPGGSHARAVP